MSKKATRQKNQPSQNSVPGGNVHAGKKSMKTNCFKPLKRKIHTFPTEVENKISAKKNRRQNKIINRSKGCEVEPCGDGRTTPSDFQNSKVKISLQKNPSGMVNAAFSGDSSVADYFVSSGHRAPKQRAGKIFPENNDYDGIVNEAFSDESGMQDVTLGSHYQTPKRTSAERYPRKTTSKGIVNKAFITESKTQDESFNRNHQTPRKRRKTGGGEREGKLKGVVNEAFGSESSSPEDSASVGRQVRQQVNKVNPSLCNTLDSAPNGQRLTRKARHTVSLRERMIARLKASRFRYLNEQIYSSESTDIQQYFANDRNSFMAYHEGFKQQVSQWPLNPLDRIISTLKKKPETLVIADFGCGDARLAHSLPNVVHSFDVVALSDKVTVCDMARTPLGDGSVDVVVFCLSLMGTNLADYLLEANRVLVVGGQLKIAEVESRFKDVNDFVRSLKKFGFTNTLKDLSHNMFYFLDFKKDNKQIKRNSLPPLTLKPCLYKKR